MRTVTRRTFLALLTASLLFVTAIPSLHAAAPVERSGRVTLLQLNDLYDIMPVEKGKKGGLARIATLRDRIAKERTGRLAGPGGRFPVALHHVQRLPGQPDGGRPQRRGP